MSKRLKISLILTTVVAVALFALSIGLTAAVWAGLGGNTGVAPQSPVSDWNTWAKYFECEQITDTTAAVTKYSGTNLGDVVIPAQIGKYKITAVRNTVFADSTLKAVPVTLRIPPSVTSIEDNAFSGLSDLQSVVFGYSESETAACTVGEFAFSGCPQLKIVKVEGSRTVSFASTAFFACPNFGGIS